jgi:hypothetical protein
MFREDKILGYLLFRADVLLFARLRFEEILGGRESKT